MAADLSRYSHERSDAAAGPLLLWGAGLFALVLAVLFLSAWLLKAFSVPQVAGERVPGPPPGVPGTASDRPGAPLSRQLEALRSVEERLLSGYEWVDRENGIVRIPIERAMDLVARQGLAVRDGGSEREGPSEGEEP